MLKNILKLEGAQQLNKAEQRNIQGGGLRDECEALGGIWNCVIHPSLNIQFCECSGLTLPNEK